MPVFELALPLSNKPLPASTPTRAKRRRRDTTDDEDSSSDSDDSHHDDDTDDDDDDDDDDDANVIVPPDFPAAPLQDRRGAGGMRRPPASKQQRNVRHQHFVVLNALLHRCLLRGDFVRAGRAFGLLLRYRLNGRRVDLRQRDLWGVGAEILLRRPQAGDGGEDGDGGLPFRDANLDEAKLYFDRLMLEYPYKKQSPRAVNEVRFLAVLFGLQIFQLQAKLARARPPRAVAVKAESEGGGNDDSSSSSSNSDDDESQSDEPHNGDEHDDDDDDEDSDSSSNGGSYSDTLAQIRHLTDRLDEKLAFPPFDRDPTLFRLKGDLWTWMADLSGSHMAEWRDIAAHAYDRARRFQPKT